MKLQCLSWIIASGGISYFIDDHVSIIAPIFTLQKNYEIFNKSVNTDLQNKFNITIIEESNKYKVIFYNNKPNIPKNYFMMYDMNIMGNYKKFKKSLNSNQKILFSFSKYFNNKLKSRENKSNLSIKPHPIEKFNIIKESELNMLDFKKQILLNNEIDIMKYPYWLESYGILIFNNEIPKTNFDLSTNM